MLRPAGNRMPYCVVNRSSVDGEVSIFFQLYGNGDTKVLLIPGLASTHELWTPQLVALCGTRVPFDGSDTGPSYQKKDADMSRSGVQVCALDNRGVGKSSKPEKKTSYSTKIMALDALSVIDHLGWQRVHVCGHSMGGMIASKLVAMAPQRFSSACFLAVTGGGYQCLPKLDKAMISLCFRFLRANTPEKRALVDLETHYTQDYLEHEVGNVKRRVSLLQEYVSNITATGMQPTHGFDGQAHACWTHSLSKDEIDSIRAAGIPILVVHGRGDVIAQVRHGRSFARKLHPVARLVELPGGHMLTHQHTAEVNEALLDLLEWSDFQGQDWSSWSANVVVEELGRQPTAGAALDEGSVGLAAFLAAVSEKLWRKPSLSISTRHESWSRTWWQVFILLILVASWAVVWGWFERLDPVRRALRRYGY